MKNSQVRGRFEMKQLLSLYHGLVEFIEGSPIQAADLDRVCAKSATAFFLIADKEAEVLLTPCFNLDFFDYFNSILLSLCS